MLDSTGGVSHEFTSLRERGVPALEWALFEWCGFVQLPGPFQTEQGS